jgi:uncharacterized alpha-E superfamily protein
VADFLIFEPVFPRSVRRCLAECRVAAHAISGRPATDPGNDVEKALADVIAWLDGHDIEDLVKAGLHESLTTVVNRTHEIGDAIHRTYFDVRHQKPVAGACAPVCDNPPPARPIDRPMAAPIR